MDLIWENLKGNTHRIKRELRSGTWVARWLLFCWCVVDTRKLVGKPQEKVMMSTAASFPSVVKPRLIEPVGESQTSEGWCLLASRQLRTIYMVPRPGLSFAPAATWNMHTTQPSTLSQLTVRLSISPVCYVQRIKRIEW
jgi:hypothetical protein